jgi:hypothetical protein
MEMTDFLPGGRMMFVPEHISLEATHPSPHLLGLLGGHLFTSVHFCISKQKGRENEIRQK